MPSSRYTQHWACMHSQNLCMMYYFPISHRRQHKPTNLSTLTFIHTFMAIALFQVPIWSQPLSCCIACSKYGTIAILNQMKKVLPIYSQQICLRFRSLSIFPSQWNNKCDKRFLTFLGIKLQINLQGFHLASIHKEMYLLRLLTTSTTLTCATFRTQMQRDPNSISLSLKSVRILDWSLIECRFTSSKMCNCCSTSLHWYLKEVKTWQTKKRQRTITHKHVYPLSCQGVIVVCS